MKTYFKQIPSHSSHKQQICSAVNELVNEHPEWYPTLVAFVSYPIQKWADNQRMKIQIDKEQLLNVIHCGDAYDNISFLERKKHNLKNTAEIISLTEEIMNAPAKTKTDLKRTDALLAAHGYIEHEITRYVFQTNYEPAMREVCKVYNNKYIALVDSVVSSYTDYTCQMDDLKFAYHNTDILIRMLNVTSRVEYRQKSRRDYDDVFLMVNKAIGSLKEYPLGGKEIYYIVRAIADGKSERGLMRSMKKSNTYISKRYKEGIYALSCILWGYSAREIAEGYLKI